MRIPRRVPWASLAELEEICSWIFADGGSSSCATQAINRLTAWRAVTPLPHALESTLSFLVAMRSDDQYMKMTSKSQTLQSGPSNAEDRMSVLSLGIRQSYATAIVRMVNGLVDPLQSGMYARSIATIAAQIGLPQWLVELRHAATHEDLPSLELLRCGAQESLAWLLHNYFIPMLSASQNQAPVSIQLSPVSPILKRIKHTMKLVTRDASLAHQYKSDLRDNHRALERWISEAKVSAISVLATGWGTNQADDSIEENERWALERLCDALIEKGGIVPVSSRKRLLRSTADPELPQDLLDIWSPLLIKVATAHPLLPSVFVTSIIDKLSQASAHQSDNKPKSDLSSYALCLVAWCLWCIRQWASDTTDSVALLQMNDVASLLLMAQGPGHHKQTSSGVSVLLQLLTRDDPVLSSQIDELKEVLTSPRLCASVSIVDEAEIHLMEERLRSVLSGNLSTAESNDLPQAKGGTFNAHESEDELPIGWSIPLEKLWKPCPIGIYQ